MKLAIRILALSVVVAGAAAASMSSSTPQSISSHQSAASSAPAPYCGPHMPGCNTPPSGN
jgi:hypothetical protein